MPQDELWAASARPTGFTFTYETPEKRLAENGLVMVRPTWSKKPGGRDGMAMMHVPPYATWSLTDVFSAAWGQFLGGDARSVGREAQHALRGVLHEFQEGARS